MMTEARMKREELQNLSNAVKKSLDWATVRYDVQLRGECDLETGMNRLAVYITLPQVEEVGKNEN